MRYFYRLALILPVAIIVCATALANENQPAPADNDESYKLPLFVPKVAQPSNAQKIIFDDKNSDNDEIYSLPKRAALRAAKPSTLNPAAGETAAQKTYNQEYEDYQRQMKLYDEQMVEYKKQLDAQQATEGKQPSDNDNSYILPGEYSPLKKNIKPKPAIARSKPQPQQAVQQPAAIPQPLPQYQPPPATNNNSQYYQRYNYSDQPERAAPAVNTDMPAYYY